VAWVPTVGGEVRLAFAIGRRVGGAVVRNRLRRRLRAIVFSLDLAPGDYLVAAGSEAVDLGFPELQAAVTTAVEALR
jgi:ribonuclease P protein component